VNQVCLSVYCIIQLCNRFIFVVLCSRGIADSGHYEICSGHGRCISLRTAANYVDGDQFTKQISYTDWDADMIHGCDCSPGWEGSTCSRKSCPKGDDPYTTGQLAEVQVIDCTCSTCVGSFRLEFQGQKTASIPFTATSALLKYRLEVIM
jgi:hypothetical protein